MVAYLAPRGKAGRKPYFSSRQPKNDKQGAIDLVRGFTVNMADDAPNAIAAQGDHLVRHDL